jgi:hypothetical protein
MIIYDQNEVLDLAGATELIHQAFLQGFSSLIELVKAGEI